MHTYTHAHIYIHIYWKHNPANRRTHHFNYVDKMSWVSECSLQNRMFHRSTKRLLFTEGRNIVQGLILRLPRQHELEADAFQTQTWKFPPLWWSSCVSSYRSKRSSWVKELRRGAGTSLQRSRLSAWVRESMRKYIKCCALPTNSSSQAEQADSFSIFFHSSRTKPLKLNGATLKGPCSAAWMNELIIARSVF